MKKRYSVRVYLRHPIYLEVESNLDDDRYAVFDAVELLMLGSNYDTAVYESVNQEAKPDIILRDDGSFEFPHSIDRWFGSRTLKVPFSRKLEEYAALVDPQAFKAYLIATGWEFPPDPIGVRPGIEVAVLTTKSGQICTQVPTSSHWSDYASSVARLVDYLAPDNPVEAFKLAAWIAREYHQAMHDKWKAVGL